MEFPGSGGPSRSYPNLYPTRSTDDQEERAFLRFLDYYYQNEDNIEALRLINHDVEDDSDEDDRLHPRENIFDLLRVSMMNDEDDYEDINDAADAIQRLQRGPEHIFMVKYSWSNRADESEVWIPVGRSLIYIITNKRIVKINRSSIAHYFSVKRKVDPAFNITLSSYRADLYSVETIDRYLA